MRFLKSLYNTFFSLEKNEIEKMSFASVARKHLGEPNKYTKDDYQKAEERTQEIVKNANERMTKSADDLVNHMIWIGGGALVLASTILLSDKLPLFGSYWLFKFSFIGFALSLIFGIASFIGDVINTSAMISAQQASEKIPELFKEAKENMTQEEAANLRSKIESAFEDFKAFVDAGRRTIMLRNLSLLIASIIFLLSIIAFMFFGVINLDQLRSEKNPVSPSIFKHDYRIAPHRGWLE